MIMRPFIPSPRCLIPIMSLLAMVAPDHVWGAELPLSSLDLNNVTQGYGEARANHSVDNKELIIGEASFTNGIGTHADSLMRVTLHGTATRFTAKVGVDSEVGNKGSVEFVVIGDGNQELWRSGVMKGGQAAKTVDVPLTGVKRLTLLITDGGDGLEFDHADWADAVITYEGTKPTLGDVRESTVILTPQPSPKPRLNGAKVTGVRPGSPFLFTVAATGEKPLIFAAKNLPAGLTLDPATGIISGAVATAGTYPVTVSATNRLGAASRVLKIVVGDKLALTPPMGWNSWNCFAGAVTEQHVRDAADAFVKAGLRDHGWQYINIDDFWMMKNNDKDTTLHGSERDAAGKINSNPRFPDMNKLTDYIHSLGLKAGLYSSPGPITCGGCVASFQHEKEDAERFAEWGFDYLKYDWCSYGRDDGKSWGDSKSKELAYLMAPYELMGKHLRAQKRDIVYSLCQYGWGNVWEWGAKVDGQCWRTTGDITDTWSSLKNIGFNQAGHEIFAEPGRWNDPDMLIVGHVGWGPSLHPTRLTPNEQYTHISLWSLLAAPLLIGCDMTKLDDFTLSLLTNDEVLEVNQDPLGFGARRIFKRGESEVYAKLLEDGSKAVGLFNLGNDEQSVSVRWRELELTGTQQVRDLWRQQDLGVKADGFTATIPRHGCMLIKVSAAK